MQDVARTFQVTPRSIERWIIRYASPQYTSDEQLGRTLGAPKTLNHYELEKLSRLTKKGQFKVAADLQRHIKKAFKKDLSVRQCQRVLSRLRCVPFD